MDKKLRNGIVVILISNMVNMIFSLLTNFLMPKYLSVNSYAEIKTFQLYISYIGLLHFGYVDGIYLRYGGKQIKKCLSSSFVTNLSTMRILEIVISISFGLFAIIKHDWILGLFCVSIFPQNVSNYYKFLFQATGEFNIYGNILNITTFITFILNMILLFSVQTDKAFVYILLTVVLYYAIWFFLEIWFRNKYEFERGKLFSFSELKISIRDGFLLMLGNLASVFLTSMDRWFVKALLTTIDFALYSFAVSIENFMNLAITPVTTTLYNYFCRERNVEKHKNIYRYILVFACFLPSLAFPVKFILEIFLKKYLQATNVIFLLFAAQIFYIIIKSIYVNLYKVNRKQKTYFMKLVIILLLGGAFNVICYKILKNKEAFAYGTLFSAIIWFIITTYDFKYLQIRKKEFCYIFIQLFIFLFLGFRLEAVEGFLMYILISMLLPFVFMPTVAQKLYNDAKRYFSKVVGGKA